MADKDAGARSHPHAMPGHSVHDQHIKGHGMGTTHISDAVDFLKSQGVLGTAVEKGSGGAKGRELSQKPGNPWPKTVSVKSYKK